MSQTAAHHVDRVIAHVPVRQWVPSLPIPLRLLLAAHPELVTPLLQVVQRVVTWHLLAAAGLVADEGRGGAVTLIQRFGSAANLNHWQRSSLTNSSTTNRSPRQSVAHIACFGSNRPSRRQVNTRNPVLDKHADFNHAVDACKTKHMW